LERGSKLAKEPSSEEVEVVGIARPEDAGREGSLTRRVSAKNQLIRKF
jgi:hypothetical protein